MNTLPGDPGANLYHPLGPNPPAKYTIHSDPPENPTATLKETLGKLKTIYR